MIWGIHQNWCKNIPEIWIWLIWIPCIELNIQVKTRKWFWNRRDMGYVLMRQQPITTWINTAIKPQNGWQFSLQQWVKPTAHDKSFFSILVACHYVLILDLLLKKLWGRDEISQNMFTPYKPLCVPLSIFYYFFFIIFLSIYIL
jgi:hypothetical protein